MTVAVVLVTVVDVGRNNGAAFGGGCRETVVDEIVVLVSVPVVGACCIADKRT